MLSDSAILKKIQRQPRQTAGYKQLVRELGLRGDERRELNDHLQKLVASGQLIADNSDRYAIPQAPSGKNLVAGKLSLHRDGFGFVIPDLTSAAPALKARLSGDIFIPPHAVGAAMQGDLVLAEVTNFRTDGRTEGRLIRSLHRANPTVVGVFHYGARHNYVTPIDSKISREIVIPKGMETPSLVVGRPSSAEAGEPSDRDRPANWPEQSKPSSSLAPDNFARTPQPTTKDQRPTTGSPHRVLGDEVTRRTDWTDLEKVVVDVEITDWPSATQDPRGRVVEILGYEDDFGVDVEIMIRKFHLPHRFPPEVLSEAKTIDPVIPSAELRSRRDFRDLPIVTIDGETARDFDDAVLVTHLATGNFELQVHIADVAHYVTPDSALDQEARLRGTSVYFPDRAVPMLPLELSTDICSLRPHVDRLVMSCVMEMDPRGEIVGCEICPGVIRSAERMTYTAVNAILEADGSARKRYSNLIGNFELMRDLQKILNKKRERRGSIDFDLPEPVIEFDENGLMKSVTRSERNIAHRIIEEFMLSANECVAGYLEGKAIPSLYRIHEKPDAKRVYDFEVIAATFGYSLGVGALPIQRMQFKSDRRANYGTGKRAKELEIPKDVHITPRMYQKLTEKIAGKPEERILSYLMLRSLKQARYSEDNAGHFALAATSYTHFTSPIRRYPDLIVHRILKDVLRDSAEQWDGEVPVGTNRATQVHQGSVREDSGHEDSQGPGFSRAAGPSTAMPGGHALSRTAGHSSAIRGGHGFSRSAGHSSAITGGHGFSRSESDHVESGASAPESRKLEIREHEEDSRASHSVPEGRASLAQRFSAGETTGSTQVPEGRPNRGEKAPDETRPGQAPLHPATDKPSPWSKRRERDPVELKDGPIPLEELHSIAEESSQSERRADEAERELMEWKKAKFMQDRVGEDFDGLITSVTKFGFFVELNDLFVEGLVPLATLTDDRYTFHENTREIIGQRSRKTYRLGQKVHVLVDRIDPVEKKIQFALLEEERPPQPKRKKRTRPV